MPSISSFDKIKVCEYLQYVPAVSTVLSVMDISKKCSLRGTLAIERPDDHFGNYVRFKSNFRISVALIPIIGNVALAIYDVVTKIFKDNSTNLREIRDLKYHNAYLEVALLNINSDNNDIKRPEQIRAKAASLADNEFTIGQGFSTYHDGLSREKYYYDVIITKNKVHQINASKIEGIAILPYSYVPTDQSNRNWTPAYYQSFTEYFESLGMTKPPKLSQWDKYAVNY